MHQESRRNTVIAAMAAAGTAGVVGVLAGVVTGGGVAGAVAAAGQALMGGAATGAAVYQTFGYRAAKARERRSPRTGLPNNLAFDEALAVGVRESAREGTICAVIYTDLVRFKQVNDELGHDVGDALLSLVAERLKTLVRPGDLVAHLSGDEFAILVKDVTNRRDVTLLGQRIVRHISRPYSIGRHDVDVGINFGIEWIDSRPARPELLKRKAERKMMRQKSAERRIRGFKPRDAETEILTVKDNAKAPTAAASLQSAPISSSVRGETGA